MLILSFRELPCKNVLLISPKLNSYYCFQHVCPESSCVYICTHEEGFIFMPDSRCVCRCTAGPLDTESSGMNDGSGSGEHFVDTEGSGYILDVIGSIIDGSGELESSGDFESSGDQGSGGTYFSYLYMFTHFTQAISLDLAVSNTTLYIL